VRRIGVILLRCLGVATICVVGTASGASADDFLPHSATAHWQYFWTDSKYNPKGTTETVAVDTKDKPTCGWQLAWTGTTSVPTGGSSGGRPTYSDQSDDGTICFQDQSSGLINTNWSGSAPPSDEPSLCPSSGSSCANSLGSVLYNIIWGSRSPVISEPLLRGTSWQATGGADGSVTSTNAYLGLRRVTVPAFPHGVTAAVVRSQIAVAGSPGDDYGSGSRTIWWVYGVGAVKVEFDHVDGSVTNAVMTTTNQTPLRPRPDQDYFPLRVGVGGTYQWVNRKHLRTPEVEKVSVAAASNRSARITAKSVSGPLRAAGDYVFALRLDGLRNTFASTAAATTARFPKLGHGRHFFTPLDLMTFGFNPVLPAYPIPGTVLRSGNRRDGQVFGVTGVTRVIGVRSVRVPAGRFRALEVRSVLSQKGFPFGSGVRTMWFAPGRGLVKLVFAHRDGSTSVVTLLKR
jgi:hypothetical protein